uniref:Uncharacterized protein n=1 Tax=Oryza nivara TaxID=4536 RepID=A0A0E0ICI3_ORYNI
MIVEASDRHNHFVHGVHLVYQVPTLEITHEEQFPGRLHDVVDIGDKLRHQG